MWSSLDVTASFWMMRFWNLVKATVFLAVLSEYLEILSFLTHGRPKKWMANILLYSSHWSDNCKEHIKHCPYLVKFVVLNSDTDQYLCGDILRSVDENFSDISTFQWNCIKILWCIPLSLSILNFKIRTTENNNFYNVNSHILWLRIPQITTDQINRFLIYSF